MLQMCGLNAFPEVQTVFGANEEPFEARYETLAAQYKAFAFKGIQTCFNWWRKPAAVGEEFRISNYNAPKFCGGKHNCYELALASPEALFSVPSEQNLQASRDATPAPSSLQFTDLHQVHPEVEEKYCLEVDSFGSAIESARVQAVKEKNNLERAEEKRILCQKIRETKRANQEAKEAKARARAARNMLASARNVIPREPVVEEEEEAEEARVTTHRAIAEEENAHPRSRPVSYTHLTLPTSDLV